MHGDVGFILLALAVLLFLVSLLQPLIERLALPATLLLAALGGAIGLLVFVWGEMPRFGLVGDLVVGLGQMGLGADSFLTLFLPPLLFTAGLGIDVRLLREEVGAVLLMAVVAVVVCVFVVGFALAPFGELGPVVALLLGAVIASTDPAAVVGLFRDIGAPRRLTVLVSGESLFNDAASIALFVILVGIVEGAAEPDIWLGVEDFFIAFGGGLVVGYLVARVLCRLFALVSNAPTAAVSLSMAGAYLSYLLAEGYLGSSGVVAVVTAALVVAVEGPTRLSAQAWEALHEAWEQLEYWANSLIFVLASMLAVRVLPDATWADLGLLAVLIAATLLARGLVLYLLLPAMAAVGAAKPVGGKYKTVILWGGLRGAVTLVLALSVVGNEKLSEEVRHFVAVLATAFVLFTLFVQGPTLRPLLRLLSLDKLSPLEAALRDRVMALSRQRVQMQTAELAKVYGLSEETVPLAPAAPSAPSDSGAVPLQAGLLTLVTREKELYIAQFHDQTLSRRLVGQLAAIAERLHDAVKSEGLEGYQRLVGDLVKFTGRLRLALWLQRRWGWSRLLAKLLVDRFELLLAMERVTRELTDYCQSDLKPLIGVDLAAELQIALHQRRALLNDAIGAVEVRYPSYAQALRRQNLFRATLRLERRAYEASLEGSLISREVFNELQRNLAERHLEVERRPDLDLGLRIPEMLGRVSLFTDLPAERLSAIAQQLRPALAYPDEHVVRKGARGTAMYFIVAGEAVVELPGSEVVLKAGDFFGEMALLTKQPRNADVRARGFCHLLLLEARDFRRVLKMDKALAEKIEKVAASRRQQD